MLNRALQAAGEDCGITVIVEERLDDQYDPEADTEDASSANSPPSSSSHAKVLDGHSLDPTDGHIFWDVSVVHPSADTFSGRSFHGKCVKHREKQKEKKYKHAVESQHNSIFLPVCFESYGAIGNKAKHLVHKIARHSISSSTITDIRNNILNMLSVQLQTGNGIIQREGIKQVLSAYPSPTRFTSSAPR